jgi:hypothetical protein
MAKKAYIGKHGKQRSLADYAEGDIVLVNENGVPAEFYVACHNYESELNSGRTLLVRRYAYDKRAWHSEDVNCWPSSDMSVWLKMEYRAMLDADVMNAIHGTRIKITRGNGDTDVVTYGENVFLLSAAELGKTPTSGNVEGSALPIASELQIAYNESGTKVAQWTRTPRTSNTTSAYVMGNNGALYTPKCSSTTTTQGGSCYSRPCFTLPKTCAVAPDGVVHGTAAAEGEYAAGSKVAYIGVNGVAKRALRGYMGVNGVARMVFGGRLVRAWVMNDKEIVPTGQYATAEFYDLEFGVKVGYCHNGDILLAMKSGTGKDYENLVFSLAEGAPEGVTITAPTEADWDTGNPAGILYVCVLHGIAQNVEFGVDMSKHPGSFKDNTSCVISVTPSGQAGARYLLRLVDNDDSVAIPSGMSETNVNLDYGVKIGYCSGGDVLLSMQSGTTTSYENLKFILCDDPPAGVTLTRGSTGFDISNASGNLYVCVLHGITDGMTIALANTGTETDYDYRELTVTVTAPSEEGS